MTFINPNKDLLTISDDQVNNALDDITKNAINKPVYYGDPLSDTTVNLNDIQQDQIVNINQFRSEFQGINGSGSSIVVLDTGIDLNHPMFGPDANGDGVADRIVYQYDFANNDNDASDVKGHGSNVTSIAAGSPTTYGNVTYTGIAPGANIIALKVFTDAGIGSFTYIEKALQWVVANAATYNIVSVNMSLGDAQNWSAKVPRYGLGDELAALKNLGIIAVSASGNDFGRLNSAYGVSYPSSDPNSLSVGATYDGDSGSWTYGTVRAFSTRADQIAPFSQRDPNLTTIFAPGAPITGANATGGLTTMQGTSQATPVITGVVALAQQLAVQKLGRRLTFDEMSNFLKSTGTTIFDGDDEDDNVKHPNPPQAYKRVDLEVLGEGVMRCADPKYVTLTLNSTVASIVEGNSSSKTISFTVTRKGAIDTATSVDYNLGGGATLGSDYTLASVDGTNLMVSGNTIYFTPGSTSATITLNVLGDVVDEASEDIVVSLANAQAAGGAGIIVNNPKTTILNDDAPSISVSDVSLSEGNTGLTNASFVVSLSGSAAELTTVKYATQNGTASSGSDYTAGTGILTFNPGQTSQTVNISVKGDITTEVDETFSLALSDPSRGQIAKATGIATILNDDAVPIVKVNPVSVTETNTSTTNANFVVYLTKASSLPITVGYTTANGTATQDSDYQPISGTLTFAPGQTLKTITVLVNGDTNFELNENFLLNLSNPTGATIGTPSTTGTIVNDDPIPSIDYSISANTPSLVEGNPGNNSLVSFLINRANFTGAASSVKYNFGGTAAGWSDYQPVSVSGDGVTASGNTINFAIGASVATLTLRVIGDSSAEIDEAVNVTLSNPNTTNATLSNPSATTTITNDDSLPLIRLTPVSVTEGDSGTTTNANFVVSLSGLTALPVTVDFNTSDGTATNTSDYQATSGTLTFAPGVGSRTISVAVNGDLNFEPNETFSLNLTNPTGGTITSTSALGTIINNDPVPNIDYTIAASTPTLAEGNTGNNSLVSFLINRANFTGTASSVKYNLSGTAAGWSDYQPVSVTGDGVTASGNTINFATGASVATLNLRVMGDVTYELDEALNVTLSNPNTTGATISTSTATTTITNDDSLPIIRTNALSVTEGNNGTTNANFVVFLGGSTALPATVDFNTTDVTANSSDYQATSGTLTFAPGVGLATISVAVNGDQDFEPNETFSLNLTNPTGGTLSTTSVLGTIVNNDPVPTIDYSISGSTPNLVEGNSGNNTLISFLINRANFTGTASSVKYNLGGTAAGWSDYQPVSVTGDGVTASGNTINFATGASVATLNLRVMGDSTYELDEALNITLSNPNTTGATISTPTATTTITNDDSLPIIRTNALSVTEGNNGTTNANFVVFLGGSTALPATVDFNTTDVTANSSDYQATSGTLTFAPGVGLATISVAVNGDSNYEANETFSLNLTNPTGANLSTTSVLGTINNDDFTLTGTDNADWLVGGSQNNILIGGLGADTLTGGLGNDSFVYNSINDQGDLITDFSSNQDKIVLTGVLASIGYTGSNPIADGVVSFSSSGSSTLIQLDPDGILPQASVPFISVQNVALTTLNNPSNFVF